MSSQQTHTPLLPSEVKLSERSNNNNNTWFEKNLISDLNDENSVKGSYDVYAMTNVQKECADRQNKEAHGSWDVLHEALWRTPYTDYADEWLSNAMFATKQFLVRAFNRTVTKSTTRKMNLILVNDENWSSYDRQTRKSRGEVRLVE